jgi:hypothetical protein
MDQDTAYQIVTALGAITKVAGECERTLLKGWPGGWTKPPTPVQARHICAIFAELTMHDPELDHERAWFLAGQCVARCEREDLAVSL